MPQVQIREGHDHAALHQAAAIVMLVLGDQCIFMLVTDEALATMVRPDAGSRMYRRSSSRRI